MISDKIKNTFFIDIETVPCAPSYSAMPPKQQELFDKKFKTKIKEGQDKETLFNENAALYADFGKIVCIAMSSVYELDGELQFKNKTWHLDNERELIVEFFGALRQLFAKYPRNLIGGHNIKEFDIPFIARRALALGVKNIPKQLIFTNKKPWELTHIFDTLEYWKMGSYSTSISLNLLCFLLNVESPKTEMDGSQVAKAYWKEKNLEKIAKYCMQDVEATARVAIAMSEVL